jgi:four helix bundle protein
MNADPLQNLRVFTLARQLNIDHYPVLSKIKDYAYRDQMVRSCLSIASNIAEGYGRNKSSQFHLFCTYALGSAYELRLQVDIGIEIGLIPAEHGKRIISQVNSLIGMLFNFMKTLR